HAVAELFQRALHLSRRLCAARLRALEHRRPLVAQLLVAFLRRFLHRADEFILEALELLQRLFQMRLAQALALRGELLEREVVRLHRLQHRLVHAGERLAEHAVGIELGSRRAEVHALGHRLHHALDLAHRELAAAQRAERELAHGGAQVLALLHRFARHSFQHFVGIHSGRLLGAANANTTDSIPSPWPRNSSRTALTTRSSWARVPSSPGRSSRRTSSSSPSCRATSTRRMWTPSTRTRPCSTRSSRTACGAA